MSLQLYHPKDVAFMICRSPKTVYRYLKKYNIPVIEHRGRGGRKEIFIKEDDVEGFIATQFNDFRFALRMIDSYLKTVKSEDQNSE